MKKSQARGTAQPRANNAQAARTPEGKTGAQVACTPKG